MNDVAQHREKFLTAMDDDFNTREAIAELFEFSHTINRTISSGSEIDQISKKNLSQTLNIYLELANILGLFEIKIEVGMKEKNITDEMIELLLEIREKLRAEKNFQLSDQIRDRLTELGVVLEDTQQGSTWKLEQ
jgi:cysteinyl-tRNA synthetase